MYILDKKEGMIFYVRKRTCIFHVRIESCIGGERTKMWNRKKQYHVCMGRHREIKLIIMYSLSLGVYNQCIHRNKHRETGEKCETDNYDLVRA